MLIVNDLTDRWRVINETINELVEEKRQIRKRIKQLEPEIKIPRPRKPYKLRSDIDQNKERTDQVSLLYKEGKTLQEIGDMYGITRERIRQILKKNGIVGKDGGGRVKNEKKHCLADGCLIKGPYSNGYCLSHYAKSKRFGDPLHVPANRVHSDVCSVDGCGRPFKGTFKGIGYCNTHRTRCYYKGDAGSTEISPVGKHKNRGNQCGINRKPRQRRLSDSQMNEIRALYVRGTSGQASEFSTTGLGKKYGVSSGYISVIVNNKI